MYPLGEQFLVDYRRAKSDSKACIVGKKYRFSVITERVIRIEYSPNGTFVDLQMVSPLYMINWNILLLFLEMFGPGVE